MWSALSTHLYSLKPEHRHTLNAHLKSLTVKVKLVCRRKQPCLKVMSNWVADKLTNQRKIWQTRLCPTLARREGKGQLVKKQCGERGKGFTGTGVQRQFAVRTAETQVKTEWAREWVEARRLQQIAKGSMRPSRAIQSEAKRSQFESVSLEKSLTQNTRVEPASQSS